MISRPALADSLDLVKPWLDPELVDSESLAQLQLVAQVLPPIHRAGFECRLAPGARQVDLQQGILPAQREMAALENGIAETGEGGRHPGWAAVKKVCEAYRSDSGITKGLRELWLELDSPDRPVESLLSLAPSLFLTLQTTPSVPGSWAALARIVIGLLAHGSSQAPAVGAVLDCAERYGRDGVRISHVGVMLGRDGGGCRIHVSGLRQDRMAQFLEEVGWSGDGADIAHLAGELFEIVDAITVCLDVGDRVGPLLGLECVFSFMQQTDPRAATLLDYLVTRDLCSSAKREALLRWPGRVSPHDTPLPWPDGLVVLGLQQPARRLGYIRRRWSHLKLTCDSGGRCLAKAYFGFEPDWSTVEGANGEVTPSRSRGQGSGAEAHRPVHRSQPIKDHLTDASRRAVEYLERVRSQSGFWREFFTSGPRGTPGRTLYQAGEEWVTAYVAWALANSSEDRGIARARKAWELLASRRRAEPGWGYNAQVVSDSDSTLWVLRFAQSLQVPDSPRLASAREFVLGHECPDGGISCYRIQDADRLRVECREEGPWDGWCASCVSITAAAVTLSIGARTLDYLLARQGEAGSWVDYWWEDDEVPTALAIEGLLAHPGAKVKPAVTRALSWLAGRIGPDGAVRGSAFATALCIQGLTRARQAGHPTPDLDSSLRWLLGAQRSDGSFPRGARLLAPRPHVIDRQAFQGEVPSSLDEDSIYTTATVLAAFNVVRDRSG